MSELLHIALYVACAVVSAFFSAAETAITSLSDAAVFRLKEEGRKGAMRLERLRADLPRTLGTLLVGNTLVNIAAGSLGAALAIGFFGERLGIVVATVVTTLLLLVISEVTPKTLAARRPARVSLALVGPIGLFVRVFAPLTGVLGAIARGLLSAFGVADEGAKDVTQADVRSLIALSHKQGTLEREETEILHRVLAFGDIPVREAVVPRARMVTLAVGSRFLDVESVCREHRYSRYPVWRKDPDDIVGILHVKDLFDVTDAEEATFDLSRHLRPAVFVPELKRAAELFGEMRRRRFHMAMVVDEAGAVAGLVTLEDLMERIVGDIADEHDEPAGKPVSDGTSLILEGGYPLASLERVLGVSFDEPEAETAAGYLLRKFGRIPRTGAKTRERDLEFVVERASARSIEKIRITRVPPSTATSERRKAS
jgi:putative hemolysin